MSTTYIDGLTETVDERLAMARTEIERLTAARDILVGTKRATRAVNGTPELKGNLALAYKTLSKSDGMHAPELGVAVGLAESAGYRLVRQLKERGLVAKHEGIWRAT